MKNLIIVLLMLFAATAAAYAEEPVSEEVPRYESSQEEPPEEGHSVLHMVLMYIPDRVLDVIDIFRLRVRVGPGFAVGARVTKPVSAYVGTHVSAYVGLPGPRERCMPRSPIGLESQSGVSASVLDATVSGGMDPNYSSTEVGADLQLGIVGFAFGFDPVEIADFVTGIFLIDLRDDDC